MGRRASIQDQIDKWHGPIRTMLGKIKLPLPLRFDIPKDKNNGNHGTLVFTW